MCEIFVNKSNYCACRHFFFIVIIIIITFVIVFRRFLTIFINKKLFFNIKEYIN